MRWVWRGAMLFVGGLFSLFFIALGMSRPIDWGCAPIGCLREPPFIGVASQVRMIDCTSVALNEGPFLPASVHAELTRAVERRYPRNSSLVRWDRAIQGEILYSARGVLETISLRVREGRIWEDRQVVTYPAFEISPDSEALYPLGSRIPLGVCDGPTRIIFLCASETSRCQLSAEPV